MASHMHRVDLIGKCLVSQLSRHFHSHTLDRTVNRYTHAVSRKSRALYRPLSTSSTRQSVNVELTSVRYPNVKRGPFSNVSDSDVALFERLIPGRVLTDITELDGFNTDWLKTCRGSSKVVLRPKTTEEVSSILKHCNSRKLAVVPQGGNTGQVGGSVPVFDEIIISTQLMNKIIHLDEISGALICQSGCVLASIDDYLSDYNLTVPLDLGAKGSCHIGGNLSTHAGGLRVIRYGPLRGSVLGVEAVLADGTIIDSLSTLRKDNTGYDVKQLFIGSEGTLGMITALSLLCPQKPQAVCVTFLGLRSFQDVLEVFKESKNQLAEILSAFEVLDAETMSIATDNLKLINPISDCPFYVLIETSGSNMDHDEEKMNVFLENMMNSGKVLDGTLATEPGKVARIWSIREGIAEGLLHDGYCYKYDVSLPLTHYYKLVEEMRERLGTSVIRVNGYGHVGDSNLHLNMTTPEFNSEVLNTIEPYVYDRVSQCQGSVSAEHGLGFKKKDYLYHSKSAASVRLMKQMKQLFDPNGIMNPYKVLPPDDQQ